MRFHTLHVRLTGHEHDAIERTAKRLGIDTSTLVRTAVMNFENRANWADRLLSEADDREVTHEELAVLLAIAPDLWSRLPRAELLKPPEQRRKPFVEQAILDLARLQGYLVMPADPAEAVLVAQLILKLERAGRIQRASTRPDSLATPAALRRGLPNAAIGILPAPSTGPRRPRMRTRPA